MDEGARAAGYGFSAAFVLRFALSFVLGHRRDAVVDGRAELARHGVRSRVEGLEHVPEAGPCVLVMNHYERPAMRVWWVAWFVTTVVAERRGRGAAAVRWMMTDRFYNYRLAGVRIPDRVIAWFLGRVARMYGMLPVSREDAGRRGGALRAAYRVLHREECVLGVTPEGGNEGDGRRLVRPVATSTCAIGWLTRGVVPVVPVGVYEGDDGTLVARFGAPFGVGARGESAAGEDVMAPVARLLPRALRGPYGDAV